MNKIKNIFLYILLLVLVLLSIIMLEEDYILASYILIIISIFPSFLQGYANSLNIFKLGFGLTRKDLFKKYAFYLINLLIETVILISFIYLFDYIIYKNNLSITLLILILIMIISASISGNLIGNIYNNFNNILYKIISIARFIVIISVCVILYYKNYHILPIIIGIIDEIICIISNYFIIKDAHFQI